jgi:TPR repeat protein
MIHKQSTTFPANPENILVADLLLSTRSLNVLTAAGIVTLRQLASQTSHDLLRSPNLGRKSLAEIEDILASHGLALGTQFPEPENPADNQARQRRTDTLSASARISACQQSAYRWYRQLAEQGCPAASNLLGYMHYWGRGTSQSHSLAIKHFKSAADMGHSLAAMNYKLCRREATASSRQ